MIQINIEEDNREIYIQKVKCPIIFLHHFVAALVQYNAEKSKRKRKDDNMKCSLFD